MSLKKLIAIFMIGAANMCFAADFMDPGGTLDWVPDQSCPDQMSKVISNVCIECFFPMRLGVQIGKGNLPDDTYAPVCICPIEVFPWVKIGVTGGAWIPEGIFEATPTEYCSSTLGGVKFASDFSNRGIGQWADGVAFYNAHYIPFPLGVIASLLMDMACQTSMTGWNMVGLWSELDPTWNDDILAAIKSPDGSPPSDILMAALEIECAAEYVAMQVSDTIYGSNWCTGASGPTFPLTGYVTYVGNPAMVSALSTSRLLSEMYRLGMQKKTWGTFDQVCFGEGEYKLYTPKRGHRMQQVAPKGEKGNHRIGDDWSAGETAMLPSIPGLRIQGHEIGIDNYIFIDWKYVECCVL